jgi:predicted RNase H-like HicB family nuclease
MSLTCPAAWPSVIQPRKCENSFSEAIQAHLEGMREDGDAIPEPSSLAEYVDA